TLMSSGAAFQNAQQTLTWVASFIRDQSSAIAGDKKAWTGPAADAFLAKMQNFADLVQAQADRIAGGDGMGDSNSVPNQLFTNGQSLAYSQQTAHALDWAGASWAAARGTASSGGQTAITGSKYEPLYRNQLEQVVDALATRYTLNYQAVTPPTSDGNP